MTVGGPTDAVTLFSLLNIFLGIGEGHCLTSSGLGLSPTSPIRLQ